MRSVFKKLAIGAGAFGAASYGTAFYMFPEIRKDQHQLIQATERIMRLSWTGAKMAYVYGLKPATMHEKHMEAAKYLHDAFLANGGIYIKIGQILASIDVLAPEEYVDQLSSLWQSAKASSFEDVKAQIEEATGKKMEDLFQSFNEKPLSAASIGQVHEAYLKNGQKVAVKVQHRWLKEQCQGDIRVIENLIGVGEEIFPEFKYKWFADELKKYVPAELNFNLEVNNAERTKEFFKKQSNIKVPHFYHDFCSDKVIIMEFVKGVSVNKVKEIRDMGIDLKEVSKLLSHCFSQQIFEFGHVHSDPHPGNIFISVDENSRDRKKPVITLLDHGLYQDLTDDVRLQYSYLWKGILMRDEEMIKKAAIDLGVGDWYPLLTAMVTRKRFDDVMDQQAEGSYDNRLRFNNTAAEKDRMQVYAKKFAKEITMVLHDINKDVLLLFKIDTFLNSITNQLGDPINKYEILARYCLEAVEQQELKNKGDSMSKIRLWYQKAATLMGLRLYGYYHSFMSLFKPHQELPDEILL